MEYFTHTLKNGMRLIHRQVKSPIAHCGLMINTGSRDEEDSEHGYAHFIEHVLFKGTKRRRAYHILSRLDDVGGDLNAYTTKEETCVHASFFKQDYARAFDLIGDIVFNSTFPQKEIDKEKEVIIDEINSYKDSPSEWIYDEFEALVFKGNPIARPVLGNKKSIQRVQQRDLQQFIANNYATNDMVMASVGDLPFKRVVAYFEKYFEAYPIIEKSTTRKQSNGYQPEIIQKNKKTHQLHCIIGNVSYSLKNDQRYAMYLLNNLIAGPTLNSRVNMALREKHGLAYNVESFFMPYTDTGIFGLYFGADKSDLPKCLKIIEKEFTKLRDTKLGILQLQRAKLQILGQLAISAENNELSMLSMAKNMLIYNDCPGFEETSKFIRNINEQEVLEVANEMLAPDKLSQLIYQ
ncbi:MAG: insulinase family protein [Bacteroidetes bacterium]|jgi:predicted Zn-dependent peptidase|nr:insulinase family protein [Bacteroidota bacterium]